MEYKRIRKDWIIWKYLDFVINYKPIVGVDLIYDMHRYLMTKHNIK